MSKLVISFLLISLVLIILACSSNKPANTAVNTSAPNSNVAADPPPASPYDEVAAGGKLYSTNCSACHRPDGSGGKIEIEGKMINPEDLTSDKFKKRSDEKLEGYITDGVPDEGMPPFKDKLSKDEIKSIVKFIRADLQKMGGDANRPVSN